MSINRVNISGNIGGDPELRTSASGTSVLRFSVAVNDRVKNQQTGEWEDKANWVDVAMFGSRAESVSKYLAKGSKVAIEGKLRQNKWQDKDGNNRSKLEVIVDEIEFMSGQQGAAQPPMQQQGYPNQQYQQPAPYAAPQQAYAPQYQQPPMQQYTTQYQAPAYTTQQGGYDSFEQSDIPF